jgi:hypothetical protein
MAERAIPGSLIWFPSIGLGVHRHYLRLSDLSGESLLAVDQRFLRKLEHHIAAISLDFVHYNFVRIPQTLKVTPAMAAGVTGSSGKWLTSW